MAKVIVMAHVEDSVKWESTFRTHTDLFRAYTVKKPVSYSMMGDNQVAVCFEPEDLAVCVAALQSPATQEAMGKDGVKGEAVKVIVFDKQVDF